MLRDAVEEGKRTEIDTRRLHQFIKCTILDGIGQSAGKRYPRRYPSACAAVNLVGSGGKGQLTLEGGQLAMDALE